mmetsp:Transcript_16053/g.45419  ORF Transcript_16053/g.45419 Transcript_16053/m.45419 type:complete len:208 (+) Transcript_16053:506-1129(+)
MVSSSRAAGGAPVARTGSGPAEGAMSPNTPAISLRPPGGACRRVVERSEMKLPAFMLAPLANLLLETGSAELELEPPESRSAMLLLPPGAACRRVVERSEMKFPAFMFEPLANLLLDTGSAWPAPAPPERRSAMLLWPPGAAWRRVVERSEMKLPAFILEPEANALLDTGAVLASSSSAPAPPDKMLAMLLLPPGAAWRRVVERSEM